MDSILKSLVLVGNPANWLGLQKQLFVLEGRNPPFDSLVSFYKDFYGRYACFPDLEVYRKELIASGEDTLLSHLEKICEDSRIKVYAEELEFLAQLDICVLGILQNDLLGVLGKTQGNLTRVGIEGVKGLSQEVEATLTELYRVRNVIRGGGETVSSLMHGEEGKRFQTYYTDIIERKRVSGVLYYGLGLKGFEHVELKQGDLFFVGGYTSHGKSILLRYLTYRMMVEYGMNALFVSLEMKHQDLFFLFLVLHANNKRIFPGTPIIETKRVTHGLLTEEEIDFMVLVEDDLLNNPAYGTLQLDQPLMANYNINDLERRIQEIEHTVMDLSVVCVDYLTLVRPYTGEKRRNVDTSDYNDMIKQFKQMCLAHQNSQGESKPFIGLTGAQISRDGLSRAVKNEGVYDLAAFFMYSEIEKSGDILCTVYMPEEFRGANRMRVQMLKNRSGELNADGYYDYHVDLASGQRILAIEERSQDEVMSALKGIVI